MAAIDDGALDLLAQIVGSNVDSLARTTDAIIASERKQGATFAKALVSFAEAIEAIPDTVRSVYLDNLIWRYAAVVDAARRVSSEDSE